MNGAKDKERAQDTTNRLHKVIYGKKTTKKTIQTFLHLFFSHRMQRERSRGDDTENKRVKRMAGEARITGALFSCPTAKSHRVPISSFSYNK